MIADPAALHPPNPDLRATCNSASSSALPEFSDMVLEVDGRFVAGNGGDWAVHLRNWRDSAGGAGNYSVAVDIISRVTILRNETWRTVLLAEEQAAFIKDRQEPNHVQIIARGPQIAMLVNGEVTAFATDPEPFERGMVGLTACNFGDTLL